MGSVVVSVDAELGWGFHDLESPPGRRVEGARAGWRRLVSLFEAHAVPATWAVVGHLMLEDCDGVHADHPLSPDWFAREQGAWATRPELRFAPELVRELLSSPVPHDVGCHSFSHVVWTDASRSAARAELEASLEAARLYGCSPRSFVFPRNAVGHRDLLAEYGFTSYRSGGESTGAVRRRFRKLLRAVGGTPPLVDPAVDRYGLVAIPPSLFLFGWKGAASRVVEPVIGDPIVEQARRGIDRAVGRDGVLHLWLHPNDIVSERAERRVREVLAHLRDRRDDTSLVVETMREVANRTLHDAGFAVPSPVGHA